MKTLNFLLILIVVCCAKAWPNVRRSPAMELLKPKNVHTLTECMHVTSEDGIFTFRKTLRKQPKLHDRIDFIDSNVDESEPAVCGIYFMADPDKLVEVEIEFSDVSCELGGLLGFVDGWELNGEYFPGIHDHELSLENRVTEFCDRGSALFKQRVSRKRKFISHQNAAVFQYKIPHRGSFVISVRFHLNPKPCNIMVEGTAPFYVLSNHGVDRNCTLMAAFPAVVTIEGVKVGGNTENVNYDCDQAKIHDKVHVGGSNGLDSYHLTKGTTVCGRSEIKGPEQTILCGVTSVRLESSGHIDNKVIISLRPADLEGEEDIALSTAVCDPL